MYVQTIFGAGTDTSSVVLEYAMVRLMQHPHAMNKLQAEVNGGTKGGLVGATAPPITLKKL
jgi:cytochrome P450